MSLDWFPFFLHMQIKKQPYQMFEFVKIYIRFLTQAKGQKTFSIVNLL